MRCLICGQAEMSQALTEVALKRDEIAVTFKRVPARVCPSCGDAAVDEAVAVKLLDIAAHLAELGLIECTHDFESP